GVPGCVETGIAHGMGAERLAGDAFLVPAREGKHTPGADEVFHDFTSRRRVARMTPGMPMVRTSPSRVIVRVCVLPTSSGLLPDSASMVSVSPLTDTLPK